MAYTINLYDGTLLATVADGTIDTAATNIKLVGKNFTGYGEIMNENIIHLLENFADVTAPTTPLVGQIWWNSALGTLTVYDGTQFKAVSSSTVSDSAPAGAVEGDLWWDSDDEQLFVYNGSATWVLVGPSFAAGSGTSGTIVEVITDDGALDHIVVSTYVADVRISITSGDASFTPVVSLAPEFPGTIDPGVNLIATGALASARFTGIATDSDALNTFAASQFLRSDIDTTAIGELTVANDVGVWVGVNSDMNISSTSGGGVGSNPGYLYNRTNGESLIIGTTETIGLGGSNIDALTIDGSTETISLINTGGAIGMSRIINMQDPTNDQDAATQAYVKLKTNDDGGGALFRDGTNTLTPNVLIGGGTGAGNGVLPSSDGTIDFGAAGSRFRDVHAVTFNGVATEATYADLAERFEADAPMEAGTVVMLGGAKEITRVNEESSDEVFGVISTRPGFLMNARSGTNETHPPIAMSGRVPVRVIGEVRKGDRLVSAGNGIARAANTDELTAFNVIGRSLEDKFTENEGTVEAIVSMNS